MSQVQKADAMLGEDFFVPRREFDGLINVVVPRLERIENLCFNDEENRPSLESIIRKIDLHITVMCDWARKLKWLVAAIGAFATSFMATFHLIKELGIL